MNTYKGLFNFHQQVFELHTTAENESRAFSNFVVQLKPLTGEIVSRIRWYFNGDVDNYSIEKVGGRDDR